MAEPTDSDVPERMTAEEFAEMQRVEPDGDDATSTGPVPSVEKTLNNGQTFTASSGMVYGADGLLCEMFHPDDAEVLAGILNKHGDSPDAHTDSEPTELPADVIELGPEIALMVLGQMLRFSKTLLPKPWLEKVPSRIAVKGDIWSILKSDDPDILLLEQRVGGQNLTEIQRLIPQYKVRLGKHLQQLKAAEQSASSREDDLTKREKAEGDKLSQHVRAQFLDEINVHRAEADKFEEYAKAEQKKIDDLEASVSGSHIVIHQFKRSEFVFLAGGYLGIADI